jgi:hypothetical protein
MHLGLKRSDSPTTDDQPPPRAWVRYSLCPGFGTETAMSIGVVIAIGVVVTFLGLLLLSGSTAREGSYRRGPGWYLDVSTPREVLMGRDLPPGLRETVPPWKIRLWLGAGVGFVLGGLVAAVTVSVFLAVLLALMGVALGGLAWDGQRRNRPARKG